MSAHLQIRIAALATAMYGALFVSGILHHFQRTGSFRALVRGFAQPHVWIALLIVVLVTYGLWKRHAWAWWLGIAAAGYQVFRIASANGLSRVPGTATLIALALLLLVIALLLPRRARLGCNR